MKLEQSLVLNRHFHSLFGVRSFDDLKAILTPVREGPRGDGHSHFLSALASLRGLQVPIDLLAECDRHVMEYEQRLRRHRGAFTLKYFQYLAVLYTELFLYMATEDPDRFVAQLNETLTRIHEREGTLGDFQPFTRSDLRRIAFFMATGSGKTLLMHIHILQVLHYLKHGKHPEALVQRNDGRAEFDNIILVTPPYEGLAKQHVEELRLSGIEARFLVDRSLSGNLFGPVVQVVEISKLVEVASADGVSIPLDELGDANLVLVDEGHKGTGSQARAWKSRQQRLSQRGFLIEYSATFAQAIAAASPKARADLISEYGRAILFDYSYRYFYHDGYGKNFHVLNLERGREEDAYGLLLAGLLVYYQQYYLWRERHDAFRPYNVEKPLWVFLGSRVSGVFSQQGRQQSDVATVVAFLRRLLEDPVQAVSSIQRILDGKSGFVDPSTGEDLVVGHLEPLLAAYDSAQRLYDDITTQIFHGKGALEVWEIKQADGELGLRVSAVGDREHPYFGLINIGDVLAFKRHLAEQLGIEVKVDQFTPGQFDRLSDPDSPLNILVGSKRFIEGWSSWRVSCMGLLNMGKSEGPQVIQLFGRGVRLKGKDWSLKRSSHLPNENPPDGLEHLETLYIFGLNAGYLQAFREMLNHEDLGVEVELPVTSMSPWPAHLPLPRVSKELKTFLTRELNPEPIIIDINLAPKVTAFSGHQERIGEVGGRVQVRLGEPSVRALLNWDDLYATLLDYKAAGRFGHIYIPRDVLPKVLEHCTVQVALSDRFNPEVLQAGARQALRAYFDRFGARWERQVEQKHLEPGALGDASEWAPSYRLTIKSPALLEEVRALLADKHRLLQDAAVPLPRLFMDRHLYNPLLLDPAQFGLEGLQLQPAGLVESEARFIRDLRGFWTHRHNQQPFAHWRIYVLRNPAKSGVRFFRNSGFYPDFILWVEDEANASTRIIFAEPHGMAFEGTQGRNADKIEAFRQLSLVSADPIFRSRNIQLEGCIITPTDPSEIPGVAGLSPEEMWEQYRIVYQDSHGLYIERVLLAGVPVTSEPEIIVLPFESDEARREAYKTMLPLYSLRAAAGYFGRSEAVEPEGWVRVEGFGPLDERMFVARAVGRSMEPRIRDGDLLVFRANPAGSRQGKIVLVECRGIADPETGGSYTVKVYRSSKVMDPDGSWKHERVVLLPLNPEYDPMVLEPDVSVDLRVIAEYVGTIRNGT